MAKRNPLSCTPANCGEVFPKCGSNSTYRNHKCRCDSCAAAHAETGKRYRETHREKVLQSKKRYREENPEKVAEGKHRWHVANREHVAEKGKRYRAEHRETVLEKKRRYAAKNSAAAVERARQWKLANPERNRENMRRKSLVRNAKKKAATVVAFTQEQLDQRMAYYGNRCWIQIPGVCTGAFDHVDHVKPLIKDGPHMLANVRPACAPCNQRKSDKWPFEAAS